MASALVVGAGVGGVAISARVTHMLRDTVQDVGEGQINIYRKRPTLLIWLGMAWVAVSVILRHWLGRAQRETVRPSPQAQLESGDQSIEGGIS